MNLKDLVKIHNIQLSDDTLKLCGDALNIMRQSKDPLHDVIHVEDILGLLSKFLKRSNEVATSDINFEILIPSICWHDVWKSYRKQTTNLFKFRLEQFWDGIGSARIFSNHVKNSNFPKFLSDEIYFSVLHHGGFFSNFIKSNIKNGHLEAEILVDLDSLDFWSMKRVKYAEKHYLDNKGKILNSKLIPVADWALHRLTDRVTKYSFEWSKVEYEKRRAALFTRAYEIMKINGYKSRYATQELPANSL